MILMLNVSNVDLMYDFVIFGFSGDLLALSELEMGDMVWFFYWGQNYLLR